ncbi:MAG TPA: ABC transporter permease [Candidatus Latescibacteria bacterium]|nr:ABC transporter permease [Candidatus Latescibacterota bacterium]
MNGRPVLTIARREYIARVRTKSFVVMTVLIPLIMGASVAIPMFLVKADSPRQRVLAVADETGLVFDSLRSLREERLADGRPRYVVERVPATPRAVSDARGLVELEAYDAFVFVPAGAVDGLPVTYYTNGVPNSREIDHIGAAFNRALIAVRLAREGLDPERITALTRSVPFDVVALKKGATPKTAQAAFAAVMAMVILMYISLTMYGAFTTQSVVNDKTSRVVEILVSTVSPTELMYGKIFGTGFAGLTQLGIWVAVTLGVSIGMPESAIAKTFHAVADVSIPALIVFFVSGFFLYASLYAGVGAICTTNEEAGQLQLPVSLLLMVAFFLAMSGVNDPGSTLIAVLSYVPFFAPILMMLRFGVGEASWFDAGVSLVGIMLTTAIIATAVGRIFRLGILMTGKRASLTEVLRRLRKA